MKSAAILHTTHLKMKRIITVLLFVLAGMVASAQWDMRFCTSADSSATCRNSGDTIKWEGDKVTRYLVLTNKSGIGSEKLRFMLFFMKTETQADLYADLSLYIQDPSVLVAVKKVMFHKKGTLRVDVLDAATNNPVTSGIITVSD